MNAADALVEVLAGRSDAREYHRRRRNRDIEQARARRQTESWQETVIGIDDDLCHHNVVRVPWDYQRCQWVDETPDAFSERTYGGSLADASPP